MATQLGSGRAGMGTRGHAFDYLCECVCLCSLRGTCQAMTLGGGCRDPALTGRKAGVGTQGPGSPSWTFFLPQSPRAFNSTGSLSVSIQARERRQKREF